MFIVLLIIALLVGVSIGIKLGLVIQAFIIVLGALFLASEYVRRMELGALIPIGMVNLMFAGIAIGDVIYFVFFLPATLGSNKTLGQVVVDIITWPFTP